MIFESFVDFLRLLYKKQKKTTLNNEMADHDELVSEFPMVEKMTTQERLKYAKKRRALQLQKYHKWIERLKMNPKKRVTKVHFVSSVMLLEAAARGDVNEVQKLLESGVNPDSTNEDGLTALHQCCIDNNEEMLRLLIRNGANVNAEDSEKWTPLHAAATCGHTNLVTYLIASGANLLAVNADGNMPYDICEDETTLDNIESEMSRSGVTQELIDETRAATEVEMLRDMKRVLEKNENLEYRDAIGATPLHIAAANGYLAVVEFLLENGAQPDVHDEDHWQPIHAAACWGHPEVLEVLVQNGADLNAKTKNGETPYDICEDPDLKARIMELKSEMEIKKSTHPLRLRRSQSQNTRSQSVRRTSLRDKNHLSHKEAVEEAKLRMAHQEKSMPENVKNSEIRPLSITNGTDQPPQIISGPKVAQVKPFQKVDLDSSTENKSKSNKENREVVMSTTGVTSGTGTTTMASLDLDHLETSIVEANRESQQQQNGKGSVVASATAASPLHNSTSFTIHVTVTTADQPPVAINNAAGMTGSLSSTSVSSSGGGGGGGQQGTLSDLKKQRQMHVKRNSSNLNNLPSNVVSTLNNQNHVNGHNNVSSAVKASSGSNQHNHHQTPPSPSADLKRFTDYSEHNTNSQKQGCCVIM